MKVLTLWQPWATLVALGVKVHETRSWSTKYRGTLAIHAAKRPVDDDGRKLLLKLRRIGAIPVSYEMPYGAIVALADLTQVVDITKAVDGWRAQDQSIYAVASDTADYLCGDFGPNRFAWRLSTVRRCSVPHKGAQGLRDLPADVEAQVLAQIRGESR